MWKRKKIGLALGSGGARGWAHLGVLKALDELNIPIHCIAGSSMGALVGSFFAAGQITRLQELASDLDWMRSLSFFMEISMSRSGLLKGHRFLKTARELMVRQRFEQLDIPFAAVATDLNSGHEVVLKSGDLLEAIRASISIPGIFAPVAHPSGLLADGGLVNPVPVEVARSMGADFIIAVDVSQGTWHEFHMPFTRATDIPKPYPAKPERPPEIILPAWLNDHIREETNNMLQKIESFWSRLEEKTKKWKEAQQERSSEPSFANVLSRSARVAEAQLARNRLALEKPEVLLSPSVENIGTLEFSRAHEAIAVGYVTTIKALSP